MFRVKRLRRIVWNGVAAASALVCVAIAVLWMRSYRVLDAVTLSRTGSVEVAYASLDGRFGEAFFVIEPSTGERGCRFVMNDHSFISPLSAFAVTPCFWMIVWMFRRIHASAPDGLCCVCGYDLRATRDRCPECGTVPEVVT